MSITILSSAARHVKLTQMPMDLSDVPVPHIISMPFPLVPNPVVPEPTPWDEFDFNLNDETDGQRKTDAVNAGGAMGTPRANNGGMQLGKSK